MLTDVSAKEPSGVRRAESRESQGLQQGVNHPFKTYHCLHEESRRAGGRTRIKGGRTWAGSEN